MATSKPMKCLSEAAEKLVHVATCILPGSESVSLESLRRRFLPPPDVLVVALPA